jgi:hypothetical protein
LTPTSAPTNTPQPTPTNGPTPTSTPSPTPGNTSGYLVASYSFNEGTGSTVSDSSGKGNNGTITGATWSTSGKYGKALSFNGTSNYVSVPDATPLELTNGMTLEAWVNPSTLSGWRTILLKEQSGNLTYALYANTDGNVPSGEMYVGANTDIRGSAQLPLNTWSHVAVTYNGSVFKFFLNGTEIFSKNISGSMSVSNGQLRIGGNTIWGEYFKGMIDEIRIYNKDLSQSEIQSDMNTGI